MSRLMMGLVGMLAAPMALASKWNMPVGVTETSREVYDLHMLIFWICVVIGVGVFGVMFYSVFAHRKSKGAKPADFHESTTVEIIWTVIPFVILIAMAIPAAGTLMRMEDVSGSEMTVKITGYQWLWEYEYLDSDVHFYSRLAPSSDAARQLDSGIDPATVDNYLLEVDNRLVLPVDTKIRFLLTANDVLHAWWVPDLALKKDAVPGFVREIWTKIDEPGVYRGQCAELCGRDHGFMPIVVEALPKDEYEQWVASYGSESMTDAVVDAGTPAATAPTTGPGALYTDKESAVDSDASDASAETSGETEVAQADASSKAAAADSASGDISKATLMADGEKVYAQNCAACHQPSGKGMEMANFPALIGSPIVTGDPATQIKQVLKGKAAMPPFAYLTDQQIASVVTYTRNSWGNDSGVVQPAAVKAQR